MSAKVESIQWPELPVEWTQRAMKDYGQLLLKGEVPSFFIFAKHPSTYTIGRAGGRENLLKSETQLQAEGHQVIEVDRGGNITWHGPGQMVGYFVFDLKAINCQDLHLFLRKIESVIINTLADIGIEGFTVKDKTGVYCGDQADKIASIGVNVSRWISRHGFCLNLDTDPQVHRNMIGCGLKDHQATSCVKVLSKPVPEQEVQSLILKHLAEVFELEIQAGQWPEDRFPFPNLKERRSA